MNRWPAILVAIALATAPLPSARAEQTGPYAQQRYERGQQLYDQKKYGDALIEFRASHELLASPNSRLFVARCLRELGRLDEAVIEYEETAREAAARTETDARYAATRDAAKGELATLQPKVGYVVVHAAELPADATVTIGARTLPAATLGLPVPVMPGEIVVALDVPGQVRSEKTVRVRAGERKEVTLVVGDKRASSVVAPVTLGAQGEAPRPASTTRTVGWIALGAGAVGLAGFATFGLLARSRYRLLQDECGDGPCAVDRGDELAAGRRWQTMANVSLVVGAIGVIGGAVLVIAGGPRDGTSPRLALGAGVGTLTLGGSF